MCKKTKKNARPRTRETRTRKDSAERLRCTATHRPPHPKRRQTTHACTKGTNAACTLGRRPDHFLIFSFTPHFLHVSQPVTRIHITYGDDKWGPTPPTQETAKNRSNLPKLYLLYQPSTGPVSIHLQETVLRA